MTRVLHLAAALCLCALPLGAQTLSVGSQVTEVTMYFDGADVTRQAEVTLPAGVTEVILPDLPAGIDLEDVQVEVPEGVVIVGLSLAKDRLPPLARQPTPAVQAAQDEVARLEAVLRTSAAEVAQIRLAALAAQEQIAVLRNLSRAGRDEPSNDELIALSRLIGDETLRALQAAHQAEQQAVAADLARADDLKALEAAQAALAALAPARDARSALSITLESPGGPAVLAISHFTYEAAWAPVFDVALTTGDAPTLRVDRAALIRQQSGEDWTGVELVLATVERSNGTAAETVYERRKSIGPEREIEMERTGAAVGAMMEPVVIVEESSEPSFAFESNGLSTLYRFPRPVSLRSGEDGLRLALNAMDFTPEIYAVSAPMYDGTQAFVTADFTNTSDEPLVSALVRVFLDGVLVGPTMMDPVPVGGVATVGFGPVQGLAVKRTVTGKSQGETGLISVSNQSNELVQIELKNLTGRDWPVRLRDRVPYSEQDDLQITHIATPPATTENFDGRRGVLEWRFDLAAGQSQTVTLETRMSWPEGQVLD